MDHEPCKSRGNCYHARGGRTGGLRRCELYGNPGTPEGSAKGGRNQPREAKIRGACIGGRNQPREAKIRGGRNGNREGKARGGRIGGRIGGPIGGRNQPREVKVRNALTMNATWGKTPEAHEARSRVALITNATWGKTLEAHEARIRAARIGARKSAEILRQKPNRQEATIAALLMTFHSDVWADIIWQRPLPRNLRGVPDLRHPIKVIGEYDGGGHNAFEDRRADDAAKDAERRAAGYAVIRETDPYILVAKFVYVVRGRFR